MITMNADDKPEDIVNAVIASPVTRIPLWRSNPENIVGILHVKDLLRALHAVDGEASKVDVASLMAPAWFVPETRPGIRAAQGLPSPQDALRSGGRRIRRSPGPCHARGHSRGDRRRHHRRARRRYAGRAPTVGRLGQCRRRGADPRSQSRDGLEFAGRGGDDRRRTGHSRGALDPGSGPELHLPRIPLPGLCAARATASPRCAFSLCRERKPAKAG